MSKWSIDFGKVQMWEADIEADSGSFIPVSLKVTYDDSEPFHLHGEWVSESAKGFISSVRLDFEIINDSGLVRMAGDSMFIFSDDQIQELVKVKGSWVYESGDTSNIPLEERKPRYPCPNDIGIVHWYSDEKDMYVLADFKIDFDWQAENPVFFFIVEYDDSMMPQKRFVVATKSIEVEYLGENSGYSVYSISGENFLLTVEQAASITDLAAKL